MPGTFVFKPIEAKLTHNAGLLSKMSPYCSFVIGDQRVDSKICEKGGKHPQWNDTVTITITNESSKVMVEVMDKDKISHDDGIGSCVIDLKEVISGEQLSKWYPLSHKDKAAGEILMEVNYKSEGANIGKGIKEEVIIDQVPDNKVFIQQTQVVEPRTFSKEVDVVETKIVTQQIEVMEPVKVLKEVQYTKAVPVEKEIEIVEPKVVKKEIEVIEPRLVTKTIQVIENVPVKKEIEVIETVTRIEKVQTMEPQTFTKEVEVIEHKPVMKTVEVSEPVHLKKDVEFVEPVITTKTITKQMQEAVIIDEKVTQSIGPATIVGMTKEHASGVVLTKEEKLLEKKVVGSSHLSKEEKLLSEKEASLLSKEEKLLSNKEASLLKDEHTTTTSKKHSKKTDK